MPNFNSAADYLKPLAIDFSNHEQIDKKDLHKNRHWKKIMKLPTLQRYEIVIIALRGLIQRQNPGFDNQLWNLLVAHDLQYMLQKGNTQFLYEVSDEIQKVRDISNLPFDVCWTIFESLKKQEFDSCLNSLLLFFKKKYKLLKNPSKVLKDFILKLSETFGDPRNSDSDNLQNDIAHLHGSFKEQEIHNSNIGAYFVDTDEGEAAWHKLDANTKETIQNYENDLFYDRSPKPSQQQKEKTIQAVQNSKLNKKHKKALIESIKKKG